MTSNKDERSSDESAEAIEPAVFNLKLQLRETNSVRVVSVPSEMRLNWLAHVIMDCFGFDGSHLYHFDGRQFEQPRSFGWPDRREIARREANIMRLSIGEVFQDTYAKSRRKIVFYYDYGDSWMIDVTRLANPKQGVPYVCSKSEGMNAIDDCGGVWGLKNAQELLEKYLADPDAGYDEYELERLEWLLGDLEERDEAQAREIITAPSREFITELLSVYKRYDVGSFQTSTSCGDLELDRFNAAESEDDEEFEFDEPQEPIRNQQPKIGRNDPCPCGSGKKYKKCCGK